MFRPRLFPAPQPRLTRPFIQGSPRIIRRDRRLQSTVETPQKKSPPPPPRRSRLRTFFRWTFRVIYISTFSGIGYFAYSDGHFIAVC